MYLILVLSFKEKNSRNINLFRKSIKKKKNPGTEEPGHQDCPLPALGVWAKEVPGSLSKVTGSWGPHLATAAV